MSDTFRISQILPEVAEEDSSDLRIFQGPVVEAMVCDVAPTNIRAYQIVVEIMICPPSEISLACPLGGTTATVGVFYDEFLQVIGGTPPYFFEIIP